MAEEQVYSLFGGSMLSEEQFSKMMDDEHAKMQEEAQLRLMPRGVSPSDLPYTPSPPLVPEVTPRLPTPPQPGPFRPLPEGPAPETPFRRLPTPPRPRLDAGLQNPAPTLEQDIQDMRRENTRQEMDIKRDRNDRAPVQIPEQPFPPTRPQGPTQVGEGSPFDSAVQLAQVYGPREDRYPDAGRLPQQYRDKQKDAPMIDFGRGVRTPQEKKEPREDYLDNLKKNEGFGLSPNELRRERVVPPPTFDERFNVPPPEKPNPPLSKADEERYSPEIAMEYFKQGANLERTNRRIAAENGPQPNVAQRFAGDFLSGAMALLPPGGPKGGTPFGRIGAPRPVAPEAPVVEGAPRYDSSTQKPGQPPIPKRPGSVPGRPLGEGPFVERGAGPGHGNPYENQKTFVQGNRVYSESTGEYGPTDSALRSVRRTEGVPPEERQTNNLERFPEGYFDRVPRERRQMGAGLSHPGFRWQIMEDGNPVGTPQMNRQKANIRADKMTSTYDKKHTVEPRPAGESELTPSERSYLDKYEIDIPRNGQ